MSSRSRQSSGGQTAGTLDWNALRDQVCVAYSMQPDQDPSFASKTVALTDNLESVVLTDPTLSASPLCLHKDLTVDVIPCPEIFAGKVSAVEESGCYLRQVFGQVRVSFIGELLNHYDARKSHTREAGNASLNAGAQSLLRALLRGDLFGLGSQSDSGILRHTTDGNPQALGSADFLTRWYTSCAQRIAQLRTIRPETHILFLCTDWRDSEGMVALGNRYASVLPFRSARDSSGYTRHFASILNDRNPVDEAIVAPCLSHLPAKQREIIVQALSHGTVENTSSPGEANSSTHTLPESSSSSRPSDPGPAPTVKSTIITKPLEQPETPRASTAWRAPLSYSAAAMSSISRTTQRSGKTVASSAATTRPGGMIFLDTNIWVEIFGSATDPDPSRIQNVLIGAHRAGLQVLLTRQLMRELHNVCPPAWQSFLLLLRPKRGVQLPFRIQILKELPVRSGRCYTASESKQQQMVGDALLLAEISAAARSHARASQQKDFAFRIYSGDKIFLLRAIEFRFPPLVSRSYHFLNSKSNLPNSSSAWQTLFQRNPRDSGLPT